MKDNTVVEVPNLEPATFFKSPMKAHWSANGQKSHVFEQFEIVLLVVKLVLPDQMIL